MQSKWNGMYNYKNFCIWCPGDDGEWICEPIEWDITAIENYKNSDQFQYHKTIATAKFYVIKYLFAAIGNMVNFNNCIFKIL